MTVDRWHKIESIFHQALQRPEADRLAFITGLCGDDGDLQREVHSILNAGAQHGGILEHDAGQLSGPLTSHDRLGMLAGTTIESYQLLSLLGSGGMGEVYLAHDPRLNRKVAVKVLLPSFSFDAERLRRFEAEARAASALNHPNIVTVFDVGTAHCGRFIVTEFVDGPTLQEKLRGSVCPLREVLSIAVQLTSALSAAHKAGIVHRDIKPANIGTRKDGLVKILDFGLAKLLDDKPEAASDSNSRQVLGTPHYMSPEQARGEKVDARSDIFSLGVVLYEMLSGVKPFEGETPSHIIVSLLDNTPVPLTVRGADTPLRLVHLVEKTLAKSRENRYTSASEILTELEHIGRELDSGLSDRAQSQLPARIRPTVVGREVELALLREGLQAASQGEGTMLCLTGEPGIGKTTVVEKFLEGLQDSSIDCLIGRGRCSATFAGTDAYLPIIEAIEDLLQGRSRAVAKDLIRTAAPQWLAHMFSKGSDAESLNLGAVSQERLKREFVAYVRDLSQAAPLILFIDDIHWADVSSVDLLDYLASRMERLRVLIVVTYRPSELLMQKHPFLRVKQELQVRGICRASSVSFLKRDGLTHYLDLEFADHTFPPPFLDLIQSRTEGNPLFMVDLIRYLRAQGVIARINGRWTVHQSLEAIASFLPESIRTMIDHKIGQLSDGDRRLLEAASVEGHEFGSAVLAKATGGDAEFVEERLSVLDQVFHFVRLIGEEALRGQIPTLRYRFVHALYQQSLHSSLTPSRRSNLSRAIAVAIRDVHPGDNSIAFKLAHLFLEARDHAKAVEFFAAAAEHSSHVFANAEVSVLARRGLLALQNLPPAPERLQYELRLQLMLGFSLSVLSGWPDEQVGAAMNRAREICQQAGRLPQLVPAVFGLCGFYVIGGQRILANQMAEQLMHIAEAGPDPVVQLGALFATGSTLYYEGRLAEARTYLEQAINLHDQQRVPDFRATYPLDVAVFARSDLSRLMWYAGYPDTGLQIAQKAQENAAPNDSQARAMAAACLATLHLFRGEVEDVRREVTRITTICQEHGLFSISLWGYFWDAWVVAETGDPAEGARKLKAAIDLCSNRLHNHGMHQYLALLAEMIANSGDTDRALRTLDEAEEWVQRTDEHFYEAEIHRIRGIALRTKGDSGAAEASLHRALNISQAQGARSLELRAAIQMAYLWRSQGKVADAYVLVSHHHAGFTEGHGTADLKKAATLLRDLRPACS